jgi:acetyl esterase/lipase
VLSLLKEGNGLNIMLNGISDGEYLRKPPDSERVAFISPMAQVRAGKYTTPTLLIHGEKDEIIPFQTAVKFIRAMSEHGIENGFLAVPNAKHIHDLKLKPGIAGWERDVAPGYKFFLDILERA